MVTVISTMFGDCLSLYTRMAIHSNQHKESTPRGKQTLIYHGKGLQIGSVNVQLYIDKYKSDKDSGV